MTGGSFCAGCLMTISRYARSVSSALESVVGDDEVTRGRVERDHRRVLGTVFGKVTVSRMAYRAPGRGNLHPADAALNLPVERHSHGLRKLAALEAARGSFQDAVDGIERACGQQLAKRQVEELAQIAAVDFEDFYEKRRASPVGAWGSVGDLSRRERDRDAPRRAASQGRFQHEPGQAPNIPKPGSRAPRRATTSGWPRSARSMTRPPSRARRPTSSPATRTPNVTRPRGPSLPTSG